MTTFYRNKAYIVRTREEWLMSGEEFYQDLGMKTPANLWEKLQKVLKLEPVEVIDCGDFLHLEANPNMVQERGLL